MLGLEISWIAANYRQTSCAKSQTALAQSIGSPNLMHVQVRVATVRAVRTLVPWGAHEIILNLTGFRDPNAVYVAEFYEPTVTVNYFAKLATDRSIKVCMCMRVLPAVSACMHVNGSLPALARLRKNAV